MYAFKHFAKEEDSGLEIAKVNIERKKSMQGLPLPKPSEQYEEFKKLYLTSYILSIEKKRLWQKTQDIIADLQRIEKTQQELTIYDGDRSEDHRKSEDSSLKRSRRKADDIERKWECHEQYCDRKYGAHASLLQHVKLKHPDAYDKYC